MSKKILVTGATGFLGSALVKSFCTLPATSVVAPLRNLNSKLPDLVEKTYISNIDQATDWTQSLTGVNVVIHSAARVHVMHEDPAQSLDKFRAINVEGTLNLARQAIQAGVKRFIFISSIKVNGESTAPGHAFSADDIPLPSDPYAISKYEAEQQLMQLANRGAIEVVIIRPVLIYGAGVGANFQRMMQWLIKGVPLPFGAVTNYRSLVSLENVVDLIRTCVDHPRAANQVFLVSDDNDVSTTQLMRSLVTYLGVNTWLVPVPVGVLVFLAGLLGRRAVAQRLFGSLQVDIQKNQELLGWRPPARLEDGLKSTVQHFLESRQ
ncbi:UDP-glucose 4-epimerase family protein [Pseudomonas fluorescens]|uniref:Nucleoside-diphosphate sugar epimerase n=1 Tax=Pseudomonas fluorescens TaxID=294 RepID=A0A0F4UKP5_PSEFL|nr:SDR family oxidoreductase [Pseudomonas fluorescens]KJZ56971.1 nucleoside-diphosphate sugar epimerase [Pseudomonas fluorescens]